MKKYRGKNYVLRGDSCDLLVKRCIPKTPDTPPKGTGRPANGSAARGQNQPCNAELASGPAEGLAVSHDTVDPDFATKGSEAAGEDYQVENRGHSDEHPEDHLENREGDRSGSQPGEIPYLLTDGLSSPPSLINNHNEGVEGSEATMVTTGGAQARADEDQLIAASPVEETQHLREEKPEKPRYMESGVDAGTGTTRAVPLGDQGVNQPSTAALLPNEDHLHHEQAGKPLGGRVLWAMATYLVGGIPGAFQMALDRLYGAGGE